MIMMRNLTREEQLDYLIEHLRNQIIALQIELDKAEIERESLRINKRLKFERNDKNE